MDEMDKAYKLVRDYIFDHVNADILEISQKTGVSELWILEFLKEERLELVSKSMVLTCEQCGAPIQTGKYCKKCKTEFDKIIVAADVRMQQIKSEEEKKTFVPRTSKMQVNVKASDLNIIK